MGTGTRGAGAGTRGGATARAAGATGRAGAGGAIEAARGGTGAGGGTSGAASPFTRRTTSGTMVPAAMPGGSTRSTPAAPVWVGLTSSAPAMRTNRTPRVPGSDLRMAQSS